MEKISSNTDKYCPSCQKSHPSKFKFCPQTGNILWLSDQVEEIANKSNSSANFTLLLLNAFQFILIIIFVLMGIFRDDPKALEPFESFSSISTSKENILNFQGNVWENQMLCDMAQAYLDRNGATKVTTQRLVNKKGSLVIGHFDSKTQVKIKIQHNDARGTDKTKSTTKKEPPEAKISTPSLLPVPSFALVRDKNEIQIEYIANPLKQQLMSDMAVAYLEKTGADHIPTPTSEEGTNCTHITGFFNNSSAIIFKLQPYNKPISVKKSEPHELTENVPPPVVQPKNRGRDFGEGSYILYYFQARSDYRDQDINSAIKNAKMAKERANNADIRRFLKILYLEKKGAIRTRNILTIPRKTRSIYNREIEAIPIEDIDDDVSAYGQITLKLVVNGIGDVQIEEFNLKHFKVDPPDKFDDLARKIRRTIEKINLRPPLGNDGKPIRVSYGRITYNVATLAKGLKLKKENL
jgi:hypothetical protein